MDNEAEVIREQMEVTRTSLQDKLETLEQQVKDTVQDAAETVQTAATAATETVQSVKDAVQETVEAVKDTVQDTVFSVKQSLDVSLHVQNHPWMMFFGAAAVGYAGARMLSRASPAQASVAPAILAAGSDKPPTNGRQADRGKRPTQPKQGFWASIAEHYKDELAKLQGLAVSAVAGMVREMLTSTTPAGLTDQVTDLVDNVTTKLGGKPVQGPLFDKPTMGTTADPEYRFESNLGRPMRTGPG